MGRAGKRKRGGGGPAEGAEGGAGGAAVTPPPQALLEARPRPGGGLGVAAFGRALLALPSGSWGGTGGGAWAFLPEASGAAGAAAASHKVSFNLRALRFSRDGRHMVTAGDDCYVRFWDSSCIPPRLLREARLPKRASAACFAGDAVLAADKFGDIFALPRSAESCGGGDDGSDVSWPARLVGGVFSNIIPALAASPSGTLAASADRSGRVRVFHVAPPSEIQCYCFGHVGFVLCLTFVGEDLVASGGADGTVRLWDARDGRELGCCSLRSSEGEFPGASVVSVASAPSGNRIAAVLQDSQEVVLLDVVARPSGLNRSAGASWKPASALGSLARVFSVDFDEQGRLWAGGADADGGVAVAQTMAATGTECGGTDPSAEKSLREGLAALSRALKGEGDGGDSSGASLEGSEGKGLLEALVTGPQVAPELRLGLGASGGGEAE